MKKLLVLLLTLCLFLPAATSAFAEAPKTLAAPQDPHVRFENDSIMFRYTIPQSIIDALENEMWDGDLHVCVDWKVNDGPWHFDDPVVRGDTYDEYDELEGPFTWDLSNIFYDEKNVQESFFTPWDFGLTGDIDIKKDKYTFRARFAFYEYEKGEDQDYVTSPWSDEVSVGGSTTAETLKALEAPANLKVEVRTKEDGMPYFYLTWTNPQSVIEANKKFPIGIKVDMKVGNGKWISETLGQEWWVPEPFETSTNFDPVVKDYIDRVEIEENTYYFRIIYAYEELDRPKVYSGYSNTVSVGIQAFYSNASSWAEEYLQSAQKMGIITDRMIGADMTAPITREEFAEIAVKFYEMVTGTKAAVGDKKFPDTNNPEILKAANVGVAAGGSDGRFNPNGLLQRQQMATMIVNTLQACYPNIIIDTSGQPDFKDQVQFAAYAIERAKFMAKYNITAGDGKGNFLPTATCTRQEAITFLVKAYNVRETYKFSN